MKNEFYISEFRPDSYNSKFQSDGEKIFKIYAKLERERISFADYYEWASPFQNGGYNEDGEWADEQILYDKYYAFWCHYNADRDELTVSVYRENIGDAITKEIYEEFKEQYIDEIRKRAKEVLEKPFLKCPKCGAIHEKFFSEQIDNGWDEPYYRCKNWCEIDDHDDDEFEFETAYVKLEDLF